MSASEETLLRAHPLALSLFLRGIEKSHMEESGHENRVTLGIDEAAAALGIGRATLFQMIAAGDAPPSFKVGTRRLFPIDDLRRWASDRAAGNAS